MSRMSRISPHIVQRIKLTVKRQVELFVRIGIHPDLNLSDKRNLAGQRLYTFFESVHHFHFISGFHLRVQLK